MTGEVNTDQAQRDIRKITGHKAIQTPSRHLDLGIDWLQ